MAAGQWYSCLDAELAAMRERARDACHAHRVMDPADRGAIAEPLADLFGSIGPGAFVEAPFHCSYGVNVVLGAGVYVNANCTLLDSARIEIGDRSMLGPGVQIYCADHHRDPIRRSEGIERARPVTIGCDVWVGGAAIVMPGVMVGDGAIIGAGAVVTRNVAAGETVVGNPARPIEKG